MEERRRHVRAKPTPDLPAHVVLQLDVTIAETLEIVDLSVSGLAIALPKRPDRDDVALRLVLGAASFDVAGRVCWSSRGMVGLELVDVPADTSKAIRRYVGELLERGG